MVNPARCVLFCLLIWLPQVHPQIILQSSVKNDSNENLELAKLTIAITRKFLIPVTSTVVVVERSLSLDSKINNTVILEYILQNTQPNIAIQLQIHRSNEQPWEYFIFIIESFEAFSDIYYLFPESLHERHFYFIIILTKYTNNLFDTINNIFKLCYQLNVIDVVILIKHPLDGVCMFTYLLFSENHCRTIQPILQHKHIRNFDSIKTIFPQKLNNFVGCPLFITGRQMGPFFYINGDKNDPQPVGAWENLSGIEGFLIRELASILNFKLQLLPFPKGRSYIGDNATYGCFLDLQNGNADVAIGAFGGVDASRSIFSTSLYYQTSAYVFVVRGTELTGLDRLAKPFSSEVWVIFAFLLIICFTFLLYQKRLSSSTLNHIFGDNFNSPTLNFVALLLGYSISRIPSAYHNFARYALLFSFVITLVLRSAYQGSLYDAIRRDGFIRTPRNYRELIKWNYKIRVSPEVASMNVFPKDKIVVDGGYLTRIKNLEAIDGPYASVILRENFVHYMQNKNWKPNGLFMTNDVFLSYHSVMFFSKNSIFLETFNEKLKALTYGGLLNKLKVNLTSEAALRSMSKRQPSKEALGYKRLKGMFDIYYVMHVLAVIVFGFEVISVRCQRLQRLFEWIG